MLAKDVIEDARNRIANDSQGEHQEFYYWCYLLCDYKLLGSNADCLGDDFSEEEDCGHGNEHRIERWHKGIQEYRESLHGCGVGQQ